MVELTALQQDDAAETVLAEIDVTDDAEANPADARRPAAPPRADAEVCADQPLTARLEALLMAADRPLTEARIAEVLGLSGKGAKGGAKKVLAALEALNAEYEQTGRAFKTERLAGGWQILTLDTFGPILNRLHTDRQQSKLSQPALETLAIIAYRQPIMRAEIEAIRGVASGEVLRGLLERRLIKITGRAEELGRPMLYGTTGEFLKVFGLASLDDLPSVKGLAPGQPKKAERSPPAAVPEAEDAAGAADDANES